MVVVDPRSARPRFGWGAEARPARWLDSSRLMFETEDFGWGNPDALNVARPQSHEFNVWKPRPGHSLVSADASLAYVLTPQGDLLRTSTRRKGWQTVRRGAVSARFMRGAKVSALAPKNGVIALCERGEARSVTLLSTAPRRPWTAVWKAPRGTVSVVGWAAGKPLPVVALEAKEGAFPTLFQLEFAP